MSYLETFAGLLLSVTSLFCFSFAVALAVMALMEGDGQLVFAMMILIVLGAALGAGAMTL